MSQSSNRVELLSGSAREIAQAVDASSDDDAVELARTLAQRINASMAGYNPRNRPAVEHLADVFMRINHAAPGAIIVNVLTDLCFYFERIGASHEGIRYGEAARRLAESCHDPALERHACNTLGTAYTDAADFGMAAIRLQRALNLARALQQPFLECAVLTTVVLLLKQMGLYRDAIDVANRALDYQIDTPPGRHLRFLNAGNGLFCAHRLHDDVAGLRYMTVGSDLLDNPEIDPVSKATFEYYRALYLISTHDSETAEHLIEAAAQRLLETPNPRIEILLGIAEALCDWASNEPARVDASQRSLRAIRERSKTMRLYHDDVLRALMQVYSLATDRRDVEAGMGFAKELVEYTTSVKRAKFYRQLSERGIDLRAAPELPDGTDDADGFDAFRGVRGWLQADEGRAAVAASAAPPDLPSDLPPPPNRANIRKHDELNAIHEDLARLRAASLKKEIRSAAYDMAENWALAAEFFDDQTGQHCFRVGRLASLLAQEIGLDEEQCQQIEHAARLHDIGKIGVNEMILLKPGPLDQSELSAMRAHTEVGAHLLEGAVDPTLRMAAVIARHHHEWWNGSGYPVGLNQETIPLVARICALADVYDALTNVRPYKTAWSHRAAVEHIVGTTGAHFDPHLIKPFLRALERHVTALALKGVQQIPDILNNTLLTSRRTLMEAVRAESGTR